jgi:hypothetical protein
LHHPNNLTVGSLSRAVIGNSLTLSLPIGDDAESVAGSAGVSVGLGEAGGFYAADWAVVEGAGAVGWGGAVGPGEGVCLGLGGLGGCGEE